MNASGQRSRLRVAIGCAIAAALLALAICFVSGLMSTYSSSAVNHATPQSEQAADVDGHASAVGEKSVEEGDATEKGSENETIDDDETPMSSGLGGGEPVAGGIGFGGFVIVGIALVAGFFLVLMRKLNGNINDMRSMFK